MTYDPPVVTLADVARAAGCPTPAAGGGRRLSGVATPAEAGPDDLTVVAAEPYARAFATTRAAAAVVGRKVRLPTSATGTVVLTVDDVDAAVSAALSLFAPPVQRPPAGVDPAARVAATARLGIDCGIGPFAVVGDRAVLGDRVLLHPGVVVGDDVVIGDDCVLYPNVVLRERVTLGRRVVVHAGSVVGSDGFGYRWDGVGHAKVPQIGTVVVEDDVEVGSCVCIDRAKFGATRVGRGTKVDNLVQIAHNVRVGPHCVLVGQAGIAGSATLGAGVVLGGQTAVRDHVTVGDGAAAAACSGIAGDVAPRTTVSGTPALPHRQSLREQAAFRRLPELIVQVRQLQEELAALQAWQADVVRRGRNDEARTTEGQTQDG